MILTGKGSTFGGPGDGPSAGNDRDDWKSEGLALFSESDVLTNWGSLFLPASEWKPDLPGLARKLNPEAFYLAMRWDYDVTPKEHLRKVMCVVTNKATGKRANARPADWGPNRTTGILVDMSPGLARFLGGTTGKSGDDYEVYVPIPGETVAPQDSHQGSQPKVEDIEPPEDLWKKNPAGTVPPPHEYQGQSWVGVLLGAVVVPLLLANATGILSLVGKALLTWLGNAVKTAEVPGVPGHLKLETATRLADPSKKWWTPLLQVALSGVVLAANEKLGSGWGSVVKSGADLAGKLLS